MLEQRESKADFRYEPKVKDLQDAMYIPKDLELLDRVLSNYQTPNEKSKQSRKASKGV